MRKLIIILAIVGTVCILLSCTAEKGLPHNGCPSWYSWKYNP